jgi:hypothetical protein
MRNLICAGGSFTVEEQPDQTRDFILTSINKIGECHLSQGFTAKAGSFGGQDHRQPRLWRRPHRRVAGQVESRR